MGTRSGLFRQTLNWSDCSQPLQNKFGNPQVVLVGGVQQASSTSALLPFRTVRRWLKLYDHAGTVQKKLLATCFEYTADNILYLADYVVIAAGAGDAWAPATAYLRPAQYSFGGAGIEHANVEVLGLSAAGVPDYCIGGTSIFAAMNVYDPGPANIVNRTAAWGWKGGGSVIEVMRAWEQTAPGRRQLVMGRIILYRDNTGSPPTGGVLQVQWIDNSPGSTITDTVTPTGASDALVSDTSLGQLPDALDTTWNNTGVATFLPRIRAADVGGITTLDFKFGARQSVVKATVIVGDYSWLGTNPGDRKYFTTGTRDRKDLNNVTDAQSFSFQLSCEDFTAQTAFVPIPNTLPGGGGTTNYNINFSNNKPVTRGVLLRNLDEVRIDFFASLEIKGDDVS